jgi:acyl carrier protein
MDATSIRSDVPLRDQVDIDSMDFLNFLIELNHDLHVDVPEVDYAQLRTLDTAVPYLAARLPP